MALYVLFALLIILQLADAWSTITLIRHGGHELNSFLAYAIACTGRDRAVILAKLAVCCIGFAMTKQPHGAVYLFALVMGYAIVVAWNLRQMRRERLI